jgi:hypothetical protein
MASTSNLSEPEWLGCTDPQRMLDHLPDLGNGRKFRLFACACTRVVWDHLSEEGRFAVEAVEEQADGLAPSRNLADFGYRIRGGVPGLPSGKALAAAADAARLCTSLEPRWAARAWDKAASCLGWLATAEVPPRLLARPTWDATLESARRRFCGLLRDLFLPFQPAPALDPDWLAWERGVVRHLAADLYRERDFLRLPVLGDALEDAGCRDEAILRHCRDEGEHARGCWLLDAILGKSPARAAG